MDAEALKNALITESATLTAEQGITDEETQVVRANEIFLDASKENPETPDGVLVRARAMANLNVPKTEDGKPKFNATEYRDATALIAVGDILKKMADHADFLPIPSAGTLEYEKKCEEAYQALSLEAFAILNEKKVGIATYAYVFGSLKSVISSLESLMLKQISGHQQELLSRFVGTKHPANGKFDIRYATYQDLVTSLEKTRQETGSNPEDYFNITHNEG